MSKAGTIVVIGLVAAACAFAALINVYLGLGLGVFCIAVFAYFLRGKKTVEKEWLKFAGEHGLKAKSSALGYPVIHGEYKGWEIEIKAKAEVDGMADTPAASTVIRARHNLNLKRKSKLSEDPEIIADKNHFILTAPAIVPTTKALTALADLLVEQAEAFRESSL